MRNEFILHISLISSSLLVGAACGDDPEALLSLRGEVVQSGDGELDPARVVLAWQQPFTTDGPVDLAEWARIEGSSPATFTLDIFAPPPDALLNHFEADDGGLALGIIIAIPEVAFSKTGLSTGDHGDKLFGVVGGHVVAYVPTDVPADSDAAAFLGGPLPAGFHLLAVSPPSEATIAAYEACIAETDGLDCEYPFDRLTPAPDDTLLELVFAVFEDLPMPNFA